MEALNWIHLLAVVWTGLLTVLLVPAIYEIGTNRKSILARVCLFEISLASGLASYTLIMLAIFHYWLPFLGVTSSLPCPAVLWLGNFLLIQVPAMNFYKAWKYKVMSSRHLRVQLRRTYRVKSVFLRALLPGYLFFAIVTAIMQALDQNYAIGSEACVFTEWYYLWLIAAPVLPLKCWENRVLLEVELPDVSIQEEVLSMKVDTVGVIFIQLFQIYTTIVFAAGGKLGGFETRSGVGGMLMVAAMSGNLISQIIMPAYQLRKRTRQSRRILPDYFVFIRSAANKKGRNMPHPPDVEQPQAAGLHPEVPAGLMEQCHTARQKEVIHLLSIQSIGQRFHNFAREMFCAESVEFIFEAFAYKSKMVLMKDQAMQLSPKSTEEKIHHLHNDTVSKIIEEFVKPDSPSEINIDCEMAMLIQKNEELIYFRGQTVQQQQGIFDKAILEVADLLALNLLTNFKIKEAQRERERSFTRPVRNDEEAAPAMGRDMGNMARIHPDDVNAIV